MDDGGTMLLRQIVKHSYSFLQEKYETARLVLTDATPAQLLTEEATNSDPSVPAAKTMARISEAAFDSDDFWRIVNVLHHRLTSINWGEWRQSYKTLVLLEFLLTHGPEDIFAEFDCDKDVIEELGCFNHVDETGFNWGACMKNKSGRIIKLLSDRHELNEARDKAQKISKEIQGFGNLIVLRSSACGLDNQPREGQEVNPNKTHRKSQRKSIVGQANDGKAEGLHAWDCPLGETGSLLQSTTEEEEEDDVSGDRCPGFYSGYCRIESEKVQDKGSFGFRSFSNLGRAKKNTIGRQMSLAN